MKISEKRITKNELILMLVGVVLLVVLVASAQIPEKVQKYINDTHERETISVHYTLYNMKFVNESNVTEKRVVDIPMPDIIPAGIIYPEPKNVPSLRKFEINKDSDHKIWSAKDPKSYITPHNEWVLHVASQLYVDKDGRIRYKNRPVPWVVSYKGNVISWTDKPFYNSYVSDDELFNFPPNGDLWQNADYYLSHGEKGD